MGVIKEALRGIVGKPFGWNSKCVGLSPTRICLARSGIICATVLSGVVTPNVYLVRIILYILSSIPSGLNFYWHQPILKMLVMVSLSMVTLMRSHVSLSLATLLCTCFHFMVFVTIPLFARVTIQTIPLFVSCLLSLLLFAVA